MIWKLDPSPMFKSAMVECMMLISRSSSGSEPSQSRMVSINLPRQFLAVFLQVSPIGFNPTVGTGEDLTNLFLHFGHSLTKKFPCSSARFSLFMPDLRWSPSMFCEIMNLMKPRSIRIFNARCVLLGTAEEKSISKFGLTPSFSSVHTPVGPRKSGMPVDVEIPAPVWTTMCLDRKIKSTNCSTLFTTICSSSKI